MIRAEGIALLHGRYIPAAPCALYLERPPWPDLHLQYMEVPDLASVPPPALAFTMGSGDNTHGDIT
jgi:hypothetical protein